MSTPLTERDYTVTGQREYRGYLPGSPNLVNLLDVSFQGRGNVVGTITVPADSANPNQVDALIRAKLDTLYQIAQLGTQG